MGKSSEPWKRSCVKAGDGGSLVNLGNMGIFQETESI